MGQVKVRAKKVGYMFHRRIKEGEVFMVDEDQTSFDRVFEVTDEKTKKVTKVRHYGWMEPADENEPITKRMKKNDPYARTELSHELDIV